MKYLVLEIQTYGNGSVGNIINAYDTFETAESAFHSVVASAVLSNLPKHTVVLLDDNGALYDVKSYVHNAE